MKVIERQHTSMAAGVINGQLMFDLQDIPASDFLEVRERIRDLLGNGYSRCSLSHSVIEEKAHTQKSEAEIRPPVHGGYENAKRVERGKRKPYLMGNMRKMLKGLTGKDQGTIVREFRRAFKKAALLDDQTILQWYNKVHGIA